MDNAMFSQFIQHFDKNAGEEGPVVLLMDSVSSHVDMSSFQYAKERGIELYRLLPNTTHIMQPLDVGVFGASKARWPQVLREHTRENPGTPIQKHNFTEKWKEAFLLFYKPLTVINSFKSSGIYPIDASAVASSKFKTGHTFNEPDHQENSEKPSEEKNSEARKAEFALEAIESELSTLTKDKYQK
ncbi:uncharacterized protein LOC130047104 [Ostrea edulis]|uniref:uncharacterized protein LOC130047104 n=1 Tax=Ostrea edulis TaxID=37623 RepID=UPI0024AF40C0|nr:uncharacterized protein LOC130047104 [Ostrea edulis]